MLAGALAFGYSAWQYDVLINGNPWLWLALLLVLFLGYIGTPILAIGLFIWSFLQQRILRVAIWSGLLICATLFIPLPSKCTSFPFDDVVTCMHASPYQLEYWVRLQAWVFNDDNSIHWNNRGLHLADEAYGDVFREIQKTISRL